MQTLQNLALTLTKQGNPLGMDLGATLCGQANIHEVSCAILTDSTVLLDAGQRELLTRLGETK